MEIDQIEAKSRSISGCDERMFTFSLAYILTSFHVVRQVKFFVEH